MSSTSEEETSINPAIMNKEECKLSVRKANGDVEMGNIQDNVQLLSHSKQNHSNKISPSIHMIPSRIRDLKAKVFEPRQVSIGPLHKGNVNLQSFEGQKAIFMHDLLRHSKQTMENCVQKVNDSLGKIKEFYGDGIQGYSDDEIAIMMVIDGCFILEFMYKSLLNSFDKKMVIEPMSMAFDLVLLENQIPFFVLQQIFECTSSGFKLVTSLRWLIIRGLVPALKFLDLELESMKEKVFTKTDHILSFIHECYMKSEKPHTKSEKRYPAVEEADEINNFSDSDSDSYHSAVEINSDPNENFELDPLLDSKSFYTAVELDRAGVNFKPHLQPPKWPLGMELEWSRFSWCRPWSKLTLRMPLLRIHNYTELVFRNLIAYEQLTSGQVAHFVTSYAIAMDLLIDNHEDVARLVKSEVLVNTIGSNEEAAKLINDMRKEICCPHFFYNEEWDEMKKHHNKFWPRNIAWLRRTYFSNPWNIIALVAGMFLFVFTVVQTYFTVNPV